MRRLFSKAIRKEKREKAGLNQKVVGSVEFRALQYMNCIMNIYDQIEKLGFDPLNGPELYIQARFQAHTFCVDLLEYLERLVVRVEGVPVGPQLPSLEV